MSAQCASRELISAIYQITERVSPPPGQPLWYLLRDIWEEMDYSKRHEIQEKLGESALVRLLDLTVIVYYFSDGIQEEVVTQAASHYVFWLDFVERANSHNR